MRDGKARAQRRAMARQGARNDARALPLTPHPSPLTPLAERREAKGAKTTCLFDVAEDAGDDICDAPARVRRRQEAVLGFDCPKVARHLAAPRHVATPCTSYGQRLGPSSQ